MLDAYASFVNVASKAVIGYNLTGTCLLLRWRIYQIVPMKYDAKDEESIKAVIASSNVIVNCIGTKFFCSPLVAECLLNTSAR